MAQNAVRLAGSGEIAAPVFLDRASRDEFAEIQPTIQIKVGLYRIDLLFASASAILDNAEGSNRVTYERRFINRFLER